MPKNPNKKDCPECEEPFEGRLNQIYCSISCKSRFHNRKARKKRKVNPIIEKITKEKNAILWRNRLILKKYVEQEVLISDLEKFRFKRNYVTDFLAMKNGNNVFNVYDYGYYFIDSKTIKIFKNVFKN